MNTRLKQFLAAENISQSQFADTIKVVRASVSHVLAGRNNPSYDFIKAIMDNYPSLNIEWLMLGKGKMYKESSSAPMPTPATVSEQPSVEEEPNLFTYEEDDPPQIVEQKIQSSNEITTKDNLAQTNIKQRIVSKIIILYDDGTYQEM
mgnify:FL=1